MVKKDLYPELNQEHTKILIHKDAPALVIAGAGSGKTLVQLIAGLSSSSSLVYI